MPPNRNPGFRTSKLPNWLRAAVFVLICLSVGLAIYLWTRNYIPAFLLFGFSFIYSIERWFTYFTRKHKPAGMLYRLLLNLSILALFGLLVWSGFDLFSPGHGTQAVFGSLIFLGELALFIWLWRVVSKNSWRRPSMKLTLACLAAVSWSSLLLV